MEKQARRAAAEICGAVIGAGFASGREIDSFFTRFGAWGWLGVAAATLVLGFAVWGVMRRPGIAGMPRKWQGHWQGWLWQGAFTALMIATGGAMLAGAGEIAALMAPVHGAYGLGMAVTLLLGCLLAGRELSVLPVVSKGLLICLAFVAAAGILLPAQEAVAVRPGDSSGGLPAGVLHGVCYGGFNAALAVPVIALTASKLDANAKKQCVMTVTGVLGVLLALGNLTLTRHAAIQGESLPFVRLMAALGKAGYWLGGVSLYLAVLTTLTASLRGLAVLLPDRRRWRVGACAAIAVTAATGFEDIVAVIYPLLGGGCFILLVLALWAEKT